MYMMDMSQNYDIQCPRNRTISDFLMNDGRWALGGPLVLDTHVHDAYVKLKSKNLNGKFMTVFRKVYVCFYILYTYFLELFS